MKLFSSPAPFLAFLAALTSVPTWANEALPIQTTLCYRAHSVVSWSYESSGNSYNGALDHVAMIRITFDEGRTTDGHRIQTTVRHPVAGLLWDQHFKNVIYTPASGVPVVCASQRWFGQSRYLGNCRLEGKLSPSPEPIACCDGEQATVFDGELWVRD